jgi:hypothetical protein
MPNFGSLTDINMIKKENSALMPANTGALFYSVSKDSNSKTRRDSLALELRSLGTPEPGR